MQTGNNVWLTQSRVVTPYSISLTKKGYPVPLTFAQLFLYKQSRGEKGIQTLDTNCVREELIRNHRIPEEQIIIATGEERGLTTSSPNIEKGIVDINCPSNL